MDTADLFYLPLIRSYVDENRRFIARPWLAARLVTLLDDPACRFVLLTAEPGTGKTAFLAWLAQQRPSWPRYFIRRDQRSPLGDAGAYSLLLRIGLQLAAVHPGLFNKDQVTVAVEQRFGKIAEVGEAVGAEVARLLASPFYRTTISVRQQAEQDLGRVVGLRIGEWVTDPRLLPLSDLQFMALIDPAEALLRAQPDEQIVILVDALDEVRYRETVGNAEGTLLHWLATCPELPSNVRFILTSRPDDELLARFRGVQRPWLRELAIGPDDVDLRAELRAYTLQLTHEPQVGAALTKIEGVEGLHATERVDAFLGQAVTKANGNIGYLDALGRAVDQAVALGDSVLLKQALELSLLPNSLEGLYAFFLQQIKDVAGRKSVELEDPRSGERRYLSVWPAVFQRVLGVLSVAREPLTLGQIRAIGGIDVVSEYLLEAMAYLRQFLDYNREADRYRLYHTTLAEFLTAESTGRDPATRAFYQDSARWHRRIVAHYRNGTATWGDVDWAQVDDYGLRNLSQHLYALSTDVAEREELFLLICSPLMFSKQARTLSHESFATDVDLALDAAATVAPCSLPQAIRLGLLRATLGAFSTNIPSEVLAGLVRVGEGQRALSYANLLPTNDRQLRAYVLIGEQAVESGALDIAHEALRLAISQVEVAECDDSTRAVLLRLQRVLRVAEADNRASSGTVRQPDPKLDPGAIQKPEYRELHPLATQLARVVLESDVQTAVDMLESQQHTLERAEILCDMVTVLADRAHFGPALAVFERMPGGADAEAQARQGYPPEDQGYYAMDIGFASMRLEAALFGLKADALQQVIAKSAGGPIPCYWRKR
jgi:hypothetical protein